MQLPSKSNAASPSDKASTLAALQKQFDGTPYPWVAIDTKIEERPDLFHAHSLATAFYQRDCRLVDTAGLQILDVGCGSGFKALALAHVNPGTQIIGVDLSPKSVELAQQRAEFFGLSDRLRFQVLNLDDLEELGQQFDYINCDETLYLSPNPLISLQAMAGVLKPTGILRTNLHDYNQRMKFLHAQKASKVLDPDSVPNSEEAIDNFLELVEFLSPSTFIKNTWSGMNPKASREAKVENIQANYLLQGDRGFTVAETFTLIEQANLTWSGLVAPQLWHWERLFVDDKDKPLPERLKTVVANLSERERLELADWLIPSNRLIDFRCSHTPPLERSPLTDWTPEQWETATIAWHPILQTEDFHRDLVDATRSLRAFNLRPHFQTPTSVVRVSAALLPALIPLRDGPQPFSRLVDRLEQVRPLDPLEQTPTQREALVKELINLLQILEENGYVFIEVSAKTPAV